MSEWPFSDAQINAVPPLFMACCTSAPFCDGKSEVESDREWRLFHPLAQAGLNPRGWTLGPPVCTSRAGRAASEGERVRCHNQPVRCLNKQRRAVRQLFHQHVYVWVPVPVQALCWRLQLNESFTRSAFAQSDCAHNVQ